MITSWKRYYPEVLEFKEDRKVEGNYIKVNSKEEAEKVLMEGGVPLYNGYVIPFNGVYGIAIKNGAIFKLDRDGNVDKLLTDYIPIKTKTVSTDEGKIFYELYLISERKDLNYGGELIEDSKIRAIKLECESDLLRNFRNGLNSILMNTGFEYMQFLKSQDDWNLLTNWITRAPMTKMVEKKGMVGVYGNTFYDDFGKIEKDGTITKGNYVVRNENNIGEWAVVEHTDINNNNKVDMSILENKDLYESMLNTRKGESRLLIPLTLATFSLSLLKSKFSRNINVPFLFVEGGTQSGKTTHLESIVLPLAGKTESLSYESTAQPIRTSLTEAQRNYCQVIDEVKVGVKPSKDEAVAGLLRQIYDRSDISVGTGSNSKVSYRGMSGAIIVGERLFQSVAESTTNRGNFLTITSEGVADTEKPIDQLYNVYREDIQELGRALIVEMLNLDIKEFENKIRKIDVPEELYEKGSGRVRNTYKITRAMLEHLESITGWDMLIEEYTEFMIDDASITESSLDNKPELKTLELIITTIADNPYNGILQIGRDYKIHKGDLFIASSSLNKFLNSLTVNDSEIITNLTELRRRLNQTIKGFKSSSAVWMPGKNGTISGILLSSKELYELEFDILSVIPLLKEDREVVAMYYNDKERLVEELNNSISESVYKKDFIDVIKKVM